jgi:epoxide hydrolase-like predicted phosphatase
MPRDKDVLLFDLGGVLVEVAPAARMLESLGLPTEPELLRRWVSVEPWVRLEVGEIDGPSFSEQFVAELGLSLDPERVLSEFEAWNLGLFPGAAETLAELRQRHRLAVLSNTNEIHARRLTGEMGIHDRVDTVFFSHLIGLRKPDERAYRHVADELSVDVTDLVFFDDNAENVEAARSLGMQAWRVEGVAALRERLAALGYL